LYRAVDHALTPWRQVTITANLVRTLLLLLSSKTRHIKLEYLFYVLKIDDIMTFEASHELMSLHTIRAKKLSTISASRHRFLFRFTARAIK